jgi:hypothetical protein
MIFGITGRLNNVPLTRGDHLLLEGVMHHYRKSPWLDDPTLEIRPRRQASVGPEPLLEMGVSAPSYPFPGSALQADGTRETLDFIADVLLHNYIPPMKHWNASHSKGR